MLPWSHKRSTRALVAIIVLGLFAFVFVCIKSRLDDEMARGMMIEIKVAENTFKSTKGIGKYGKLKELVDGGLIRSLVDGEYASYRYEIKTDGDSYEAIAIPKERNDKKQYVGWSLYLDESGVIRGRPYGKADEYSVAGKDDEPVRYQ